MGCFKTVGFTGRKSLKQSSVVRATSNTRSSSLRTHVHFHVSSKQKLKFSFDGYFDDSTNNESLYNTICQPPVEAILQGRSANLICYGAEGSGKSYTLEGDQSIGSPDTGLLFQCTNQLLSALSDLADPRTKLTGSATKSQLQPALRCIVYVYQVKAGSAVQDMLRTVSASVPQLKRVKGTGALLGFNGVHISSVGELMSLCTLHFLGRG